MRTRTLITLLVCGFCLLAAGYAPAQMTSADTTGIVTPEERVVAADAQGQEAQGEQPSGEVQERAVPGIMTPGVTAPQRAPMTAPGVIPSRPIAPGGMSVAPLTKAECTGLNCKVVDDVKCPDVGGLRQRCICKAGTEGLCIDEVK